MRGFALEGFGPPLGFLREGEAGRCQRCHGREHMIEARLRMLQQGASVSPCAKTATKTLLFRDHQLNHAWETRDRVLVRITREGGARDPRWVGCNASS